VKNSVYLAWILLLTREPGPSYDTILKAHPPCGSAMAHLSSHFHLPTGERDFGGRGDTAERVITMPPFILLLLTLAIFAGAFGYMTFRHEVERRAAAALEKKRNQYHDRA
jgi:hypothetical protein